MKQIALSLILLFALSVTSCKKDPFEDYQGTWSGTYTGDSEGTWTAEIDLLGVVTGTAATSLAPSTTFPMTGNVTEEGAFAATVNFALGTLTFAGQIDGTNISGTWTSSLGGFTGNWSGTKQ